MRCSDGDGRSPVRGVRSCADARVLDAHGGWLTQWRLNFAALEIAHLRSHADLHPCPYDWQSLRVFAEKRPDELWHMQYLERDEAHKVLELNQLRELASHALRQRAIEKIMARHRRKRDVEREKAERLAALEEQLQQTDHREASFRTRTLNLTITPTLVLTRTRTLSLTTPDPDPNPSQESLHSADHSGDGRGQLRL